MGREVKRVSINFDLFEREGRTTWKGYLLDSIKCLLCKGSKKTLSNKTCPLCEGEGICWPKVEIPKCYDKEEEGYQIWQDVSEGGPVSPVFLKPEDLALWMVENDDSITRDTTFDGWLKFIKAEGWAPSGVMMNGNIGSGVSKFENGEEGK